MGLDEPVYSPPQKVEMVLLVMLLAAALFDVLYRRIPNWITVSGVVLGLVINTVLRSARRRPGVLPGRAGRVVWHLCGALRLAGDGRG